MPYVTVFEITQKPFQWWFSAVRFDCYFRWVRNDSDCQKMAIPDTREIHRLFLRHIRVSLEHWDVYWNFLAVPKVRRSLSNWEI
jgi:hypothetical protein